ncbi:APC membrane recruitment protein 1 [Pygocentrus nattereri]|uniref:APC membrane recruitment protein 1 n=1 Tax=Pygocentrus nattereri TaxID=42514 RepID=A0A3B4DX03_PYGNA|nr:APC membrane recruitment protein 1 [Pygocentrus nattereri]
METVAGSEPAGAAGGQPSDFISHDPQQPQTPPTGKLRKTAFKFFGGRKSICMLPSFFGGRGKGQGRGSSKTGVTKSQTYDGVSRGCWEESIRGGGDVTSADFEFLNPNGSCDPQKTQEGFGKSQSLPRQRRGLRGLFSSIRRHRKNKHIEQERNETLEMSSGETVPQSNLGRYSDDGDSRLGEVSEPDVPTAVDGSDSAKPLASAADECTKDEMLVPEKQKSKGKVVEEGDKEKRGDERKDGDEKQEGQRKGRLATYRQPLSADSEMDRLAELNADLPEGQLPATSASSDNVNLMFGDVSSLKSFDSLTGCGDIIADQDDVSVAESSVSGERGSRNAGKRSSCLITYQGGGEEMATPDEVDSEYLHSLWESDVGNEVCYLPSEQTDSLSITPDQPIGSFHTATTSSSGNTSTSPLGGTETALTPTDLLTPQSDQQESVPNSDEGYYDSTTPGADEETRERPQQERLPRDSYSGDALYELFEPDDRLLSPPLPSKDSHGFLGAPLQGSKGKGDLLYALTSAALETGAMETEEERLSKIQHALLCCELQNLRSPSKDQLLYCGDCFYSATTPLEGNCKNSAEEGLQKHGTRSLQGSHVIKEALSHGGPQLQHKPLYGPVTDSRFSPKVSRTPSILQDTILFSKQERSEASDGSALPSTRGCSQSQEELMVCFSQALVDFTKNTRMYRNSTESLDGSESSSPFGPSLSALPAIVTFDVVDMENEGECEQQTELAEEEEELSSPYEPFEDDGCYLQQDAFAECDQRTFDAYEQSLLVSNAWGITSLPRHLSLGRPGPPVPAPLALNRRSRSLDTDSLDFQTSALYASVVSHGPKMAPSLQHRKNSPEMGDCCDMASPRLSERGRIDGWRQGHGSEFDSPRKATLSSQQQQKFSRGSPWMETMSSCTSTCHQTVRPSHLPLQASCRNGSSARIARADAEGDVMTGGGDAMYPCSYPPSGTQWKSRPVGVTQGIPHLRADQLENPREITAKSRRAEIEGEFSPATPKRTM